MSQSQTAELIGEFEYEKIAFQEDDPENRTIIGELRDRTTIKGRAAQAELSPGVTYRFWGHWTNHPRYGKQFHFSSFCVCRPITEAGLVRYISQCRGFGPVRAKAVFRAYGQDCLEMIRNSPADVAGLVKGLPEDMVRAAGELLTRDAESEMLIADLMGLLGGRGFRRKLPLECAERWRLKATDRIRENPYCLLAFSGVGFILTDRLYLDLGLDPTAIIRQGMCLWYSIYSDSEGHVWFPFSVAEAYLRKLNQKPNIEAALDWAVENGRLVSRVREGRVWVADATLAAHEANIANRLAAAENGTSRWPVVEGTEEDDGQPSLHQAAQLTIATQGSIGILAGGPGTGKTFSVGALVKLCGTSPDTTAVCAPTGKAAVRITESLANQGVTIQARTIHSTLGVLASEGGWSFLHDAENPLDVDWIFVDESSMVDVPIMSALLSARGHAHILLIGDPDQLSPVGPGAPLRDMIAAGVPCGRLTKTRRNAGQIVETCKAIRDRHVMEWADELRIDLGKNLIHEETDSPEVSIEALFHYISDAVNWNTESEEGDFHADPVWDVQVVTAVNEASPLGRVPLNKLLQEQLNPTGEQVKGNPFRVGDKIVCTQNGDLPLLSENGENAPSDAKTRVANGEQARVLKVTAGYTEAAISAPDRIIRIPKGQTGGEDGGNGCNWELGYAISVHKSQGSEWPVVLILIDSYPGAVRLCDRHWLYTAISRPKLYGVTIGKADVARGMVRKSHMWKRKTFLREDLEELRLAESVHSWEQGLQEIENGRGHACENHS